MRMNLGLIPIKGFTPHAPNGGSLCNLHLGKKVVTEAGRLPECTHGGSCLAQFRNTEGRFCTMNHSPYAEPARK